MARNRASLFVAGLFLGDSLLFRRSHPFGDRRLETGFCRAECRLPSCSDPKRRCSRLGPRGAFPGLCRTAMWSAAPAARRTSGHASKLELACTVWSFCLSDLCQPGEQNVSAGELPVAVKNAPSTHSRHDHHRLDRLPDLLPRSKHRTFRLGCRPISVKAKVKSHKWFCRGHARFTCKK